MNFSFPSSRFAVLLLTCGISAGLLACAPKPVTGWNSSPETTAGPAIAAPDTVTLRLAEAAEKAANSLDNISRMEGTQPIEGDAQGMGSNSGTGMGTGMGMGTGIAGGTSATGMTGVSSGAPVNLSAPSASMLPANLPIGGMGGYNNASYAVAPPLGINAQQAQQQQPAQPPAGAPSELTAPVTIKWYGPIEPLLGKLAARANYQFKPEGAAPPVPLTVSLDVFNQPLIEVIKSAALQVARKADVDLDAGTQRLTLRYAPADKGSF